MAERIPTRTQARLYCDWNVFAKDEKRATTNKDHPYYILDRMDFPLFTKDWTAQDEITLLKGISQFLLVETIPPYPSGGNPFQEFATRENYPPPLTKNKVNHIKLL